MRTLLVAALVSVGVTAFAAQEKSCKVDVRINGAAAKELYQSLALSEAPVADEHGGQAFAKAKYGTLVGCEMRLDDSSTECWTIQEQPCN